MPGLLITLKEQETVLNGLMAQGARVRETKRGFMVTFPNGQSGAISFQGDHRRIKNGRGLVRRNGLAWPLDPPETTPKEKNTMTMVDPIGGGTLVTEFPDYLAAVPKPENMAAVREIVGGRVEITLPEIQKGTAVSANAIKQSLLRLGFLQRQAQPGAPGNAAKPWVKVNPDGGLPDVVTWTHERANTGRRASPSFMASQVQDDRADRRKERHPDHAPALPPFVPLEETTAEKRERIRREQPEDLNGPVITMTVEERDRMLRQEPEVLEAASEVIVTDEVPEVVRMDDQTPVETAEEGWLREAEALESRALAAEMEVERIRGVISDVETERDEYKQRAHDLLQNVTDAERQRATAEIEVATLAAARDETIALMDRARTEIQRLQSEVEAANVALPTTIAQRDALAAEIEGKDLTIAALERDLAASDRIVVNNTAMGDDTWEMDDDMLSDIAPDLARFAAALGLELRVRRAR